MTKNTVTQIILTADEGFYLTNGETYGKTIILPESANANNWWEITEAEYKQKQKELAENAVIDENTDNKQEVI
jgi:hypothetical protein